MNLVREQIFNKGNFGSTTKNKESKFDSKIWLHGITKGNIKGSVYIQCSPIIRQAICGVNTEKTKVQKSVSVIFNDLMGTKRNIKLRKMREELKILDDLKKSLEDNEFNILGKNQNNKTGKMKEEIDDMKENLTKMLSILQKTEFSTMICF